MKPARLMGGPPLSARAVAMLCLASALLAFGGACALPRLTGRAPAVRLAVVDLAGVVRQQQAASVALLADDVSDQHARNTALATAQGFGKRLDAEVIGLSRECGCVLLMREAVISGDIEDLTPRLTERLSKR